VKPKILHVIDHTCEGGAQVFIRQVIENLNQEFVFSVAVLGRRGWFSSVYERLGVSILNFGTGQSNWNPLSIVELVRAIRRDRYDLVHTHLLKSSILGVLAAKLTGCKVILHDHSSISPFSVKLYFKNWFVRHIYLLLYRMVLTSCHRVIVLTPQAYEVYRQFFSIDSQKLAVVAHGVEPTQRRDVRRIPRLSIRAELGLSPKTRVVLMVGRLEPEKDWSTFLRVAEEVPRVAPHNCVFLVVGSGSEERYLREYVTKHKVKGVYFLGYRTDVLQLIADADVFLLTSRIEPFGIVLLEAMMVGCPVVATRSGGPETILVDGTDALLAEVGDVEGLAKKVVRVMGDEHLRYHLVHNAQRKISQFYSVRNSSQKLAAIYEQVLGHGY
jgi:glycosyltransferase involved in cell wall biosynthesis